MADFIKSYQSNVGLNHVPAYQVSGRPFVEAKNAGTAAKVDFPSLIVTGKQTPDLRS